jgi:hypothetical protein
LPLAAPGTTYRMSPKFQKNIESVLSLSYRLRTTISSTLSPLSHVSLQWSRDHLLHISLWSSPSVWAALSFSSHTIPLPPPYLPSTRSSLVNHSCQNSVLLKLFLSLLIILILLTHNLLFFHRTIVLSDRLALIIIMFTHFPSTLLATSVRTWQHPETAICCHLQLQAGG